MRAILAKWILRLWGFTYDNYPNHIKKMILVVVPHTSSWDFPLGLLIRAAWKARVGYVGKAALFKFPQSIFFRAFGGMPVDRTKNNKLVDDIAAMFSKREEMVIALAPEGTRKRVESLKSGFYYIAKKAQVPILMVKFDIANKHIGVASPFMVHERLQDTMKHVSQYYKGTIGFIPEMSYI